MQFKATSGSLKDALTQVRGVIPSNPNYVAYSGALISVSEERIALTGSDGESYHVAVCQGEALKPGQALLLPKPLTAFLSTLGSAEILEVSLTESGDVAVARGGGESYTFRPLSATYPTPPTSSTAPESVELKGLAAALASVKPAVARDTQAVQVQAGADGLALCATDTFRLAWALVPDVVLEDATCVLPVGALERITKSETGMIAIDTTSRLVHFKAPTYETSSRMLATPFPAVESVLASIPETSCSVDTAALHQAVARLSAVADQAPIRVILDKDAARLSVSTADLGSGEEEVPILGGPELPFEILIRAPYLSDSLAALPDAAAHVHFSGPLQPLFLTSGDATVQMTHAIMPVRG